MFHANMTSRAGCVDELSVAGGDTDVRGARRDGREDDEVAGCQRISLDRRAGLVPIGGQPRQVDAMLGEHLPSKPAAVESIE